MHRAIFVGHLKPIKDPMAALRAFEMLQLDRPAELHMCGVGPLEGVLRSCAARLPQNRRVLFHGSLSRATLLRRLPQFDLLIACSRFESFGLAALEAVAAGVAVLALRGRGYGAWLPESLQADVPGPGTPSALRDLRLARAWSQLGSDIERRRRLADRQHRAAQPFLDLNRGREHCRERARWLIQARAGQQPAGAPH